MAEGREAVVRPGSTSFSSLPVPPERDIRIRGLHRSSLKVLKLNGSVLLNSTGSEKKKKHIKKNYAMHLCGYAVGSLYLLSVHLTVDSSMRHTEEDMLHFLQLMLILFAKLNLMRASRSK